MTAPSRSARTDLAAAAMPQAATAAHAEPSGGSAQSGNRSAEEKKLEQTLDPNEQVVHGREAISHGHVDMGPKFVDGAWKLMLHDDHAEPAVWRDLEDTVFTVPDAAKMSKPEGPKYDFVQADAGQEVYVVPQTEKQGVVWPGWNIQDPQVEKELGTGATLTLHDVRGPGQFSLYLENGNFSAPEVLWDSSKGGHQDICVPKNTHTHANWIFTRPGVYSLDVEAKAKLANGRQVSDTETLRFAVEDGKTAQDAFDAATAADRDQRSDAKDAGSASAKLSADGQQASEQGRSGQESSQGGQSNGQGGGQGSAEAQDAEQSSRASSGTWLLLGLGAVVLVGGVVAAVLSRRGKKAKEQAMEDER